MSKEKIEWKNDEDSAEVAVGRLRVSVHPHIDEPGKLFVSAYSIGIDRVVLRSVNLEPAKREALRFVRDYLGDRRAEAVRAILETGYEG